MIVKKTFYNKDNYRKLFLSPYCFIQKMDDGIHVRKTDCSESFLFSGNFVEELFSKLSSGIDIDELLQELQRYIGDESEAWLEMTISKGFLV